MMRCLWIGMALLVAAAPASANLLVNGDFEDGVTGNIGDGVPGWSVWGASGWHHDDAGRVIDQKAVKFWWDDAGMWQDFAVVGGNDYDFSVQAFNWSGDQLTGWNGVIKAEFYNSAIGTDPGDVLLAIDLDRYYSASDLVDAWVEIGDTVTAPATADIGRIVLLIADWQSTGVGGALNFDNASVTPEPASIVALVGMALVALRRR